MTLYEQLGIEQKAAPEEIKRAYFRLVRQYTPEKHPERFMSIRGAYETLSDPEKRKAYDEGLSCLSGVPAELQSAVMEARRLSVKGLPEEAARLLENPAYRKYGDIQQLLCKLYFDMEKYGKAVKVADGLLREQPDNLVYLRLTVKAYEKRGWTKKAHELRRKLEQLDPGNEINSAALLFDEAEQHPLLMGASVAAIEAKGKKAPILCAYILRNCLGLRDDSMEHIRTYLSVRLASENPEPWNEPLFAAKKLAQHTEDIPAEKRGRLRGLLSDDILRLMFNEDRYDILPFVDQAIRNTGAEEIFQTDEYKIAWAGYTALKAVQAGIPKKLACLPLMQVWAKAGPIHETMREEFQDEILVLEMEILNSYERFPAHIRRFRTEFASFYQYAEDFLSLVEQSADQKLQKEFFKRLPRARKIDKRLVFDWLGKDEPWSTPEGSGERGEPVRVTKTGRNEPCPCGSGKKYKKCCGR